MRALSAQRAVRLLALIVLPTIAAGCGAPVDRNTPADAARPSGSTSNRSNQSVARPASGRAGPAAAIVNEDGVANRQGILPILLIDVRGRAITGDAETAGVLTVIEEHDGSLTNLSSRVAALRSAVAVELHGDTSAGLAKKSYRIELVDDRRKDRELPLLGLPAGSDWVLHSCGYDPICLRNVLVYTLGRELGHYAPRTRFVELFMNGAYQGLYVLIERVRRDNDRVNLPRPAATTAGDITGGYIFKTDLGEGSPTDAVPRDWVSPVSRTVYSYYYPRYDAITSAQRTYLRDHMTRFEALMRSSRWNDPRTGYREWLDLPSWVDFALIQELSMNPDAYFKSVYLQKWPRSMGNKIAIGPFWDFDLAFGVAEFRDARNTEAWAHAMNRFGGERVLYNPPGTVPYVPDYWERLWTDAAFQQALQCRWRELRGSLLQMDTLNRRLDGWLQQLAVALPRDAALWKDLPKNSYSGGAAALKEFLGKRVAWMDTHLPGRCAAS